MESSAFDAGRAERIARDFLDTGNRVAGEQDAPVRWEDLDDEDRAFMLEIFGDMVSRGVL